jgi:hypothetical protein
MFLPDYTDSRHGQKFKSAAGGFSILILLNPQTKRTSIANTIPEHALAYSSKY